MLDDYKENCGEATPFMYSVPNLRVTSCARAPQCRHADVDARPRRRARTVRHRIGDGRVGRSTENGPGSTARRSTNRRSTKARTCHFPRGISLECYTPGKEKFGWANRNPEVGSMKRDGLTLGWGMVGCTWIAGRFDAKVGLELRDDGTARIASATQDIGTGTYTVLAQLASEKLGLPVNKIEVVLGDTDLPPGPISGGSMATASLVPAASNAAGKLDRVVAVGRLDKVPNSKFADQRSSDLAFTDGRVHKKNEPASAGVPFEELLKQGNLHAVSGVGSSDGTFGGKEKPKFSSHSYGAHFVEVTWQPEIARLRVSRVVTVIDAGRILNPLAGRNQIEGAVVMGIGMCLFEETAYDPQNGAPYNANLADYIVATNPDVPKLEVHFLDYPDMHLNELGARGIGEIGLAGTAAAIANAVYHATGVARAQIADPNRGFARRMTRLRKHNCSPAVVRPRAGNIIDDPQRIQRNDLAGRAALNAAAEPAILATLFAANGSTYRPLGSMMSAGHRRHSWPGESAAAAWRNSSPVAAVCSPISSRPSCSASTLIRTPIMPTRRRLAVEARSRCWSSDLRRSTWRFSIGSPRRTTPIRPRPRPA